MTDDPEPNWRRWERQMDPERPELDTLRAGVREWAAALRRMVVRVRVALGVVVAGPQRLQLPPVPREADEDTREES